MTSSVPPADATPGLGPGSPASGAGGTRPVPTVLAPHPERPAFRHRLGLRPLDPSAWIVVDDGLAAALALKEALLAERHDEVVAAVPGSEPAGIELVHALRAHLLADHPGHYRAAGDGVEVLAKGRVIPLATPGRHGIDTAGRLVQEDLCLLDDGAGEPVLVAASLCSPNRWRLADKIGRDMLAVHEPVPGYAAQIGATVDATLQRLTPDRPVWRANWGIADDEALFQPSPPPPLEGLDDPAEAAARLWLRVERQTLRRLPRTGVIVFTIRTFQTRLADLAGQAATAAGLLGAVTQLPPDVARYKNVAPYADAVLRWLARCAEPAGS